MEGTDSPPPDNTERLIGALQACFSDLLEAQKEQTDKLHKAVEALHIKPPVAEKKTTFWKQYQTLADEHDKELLQKLSTDLDASLIFAGLFSAVSSAFIIQIEPQIQPEGSSTLILVSQCLLYFSLFSTLLAALLAVLGKQWLMYYSAAGERGTIDARGLERQRKFDGLQRWNFTPVMHLFPLLLQLALFLFSAALSVYLWTVHISLAIIVLLSTSGGLTAYIFLLMTSVLSPDSPFQNPLAPFLKMLDPRRLLARLKEHFEQAHAPKRPSHLLPRFVSPNPTPSDKGIPPLSPGMFPAPSPEAPAVAWVLETSTDPLVIASAAEIAVDLQWPINTDLAAPLARLRDSFLACFVLVDNSDRGYNNDTGRGGFVPLQSVRAGMVTRAITYGRAYCVLRLAHRPVASATNDWVLEVISPIREDVPPELLNVVRILQGTPDLDVGPGAGATGAVRWALRVIPSLPRNLNSGYERLDHFLAGFYPTRPAALHLDSSGFVDYLFCLNSFFQTMNNEDMVLIDKSSIKDHLMCQLLDTLSARIEAGKFHLQIFTAILGTTLRLARQVENTEWYSSRSSHETTKDRKTAVYRLCRIIHNHHPGSLTAMTAASQLASVDTVHVHPLSGRGDALALGGAEWVHVSLEELNSERVEWDATALAVVESLLQALLFYPGDPTQNIPVATFRAIVHALSIPDPASHTASVLLMHHTSWFTDARLWPIIELSTLWSDLGRVVQRQSRTFLRSGYFGRNYVDLGHALARIPAWVPIIRRDLPGWLNAWSTSPPPGPEMVEKFGSVLVTCWLPESTVRASLTHSEIVNGLVLAALTTVWLAMDFGSLADFFPVAHCMHSSAMRDTIFSPYFKSEYQAPLGSALLLAAGNARDMSRNGDIGNYGTVLDGVSNLLELLAHTILSGSHHERVDFYWRLQDRVDKLERAFQLVGQKQAEEQSRVVLDPLTPLNRSD